MIHDRGSAEPNYIAIVAILIVLALILSGFFKNNRVLWDTFNIKSLLRLPCGITVQNPKPNTKIIFPVQVSGYINQCGWIFDQPIGGGRSGGTAQIFDDKGMPVTRPFGLLIPDTAEDYPMYFGNQLPLLTAPTTDTGKIVFVSTTGLIYSVPISF